MNIIDNFLSESELNLVGYTMVGDEAKFPWYYNCTKVFGDDPRGQFTHSFYIEKPKSDYYKMIEDIFLPKIKFNKVLRVKANMTFKTHEPINYGMHIDFSQPKFNQKTAIWYLETTNGPTSFMSYENIECVGNRYVEFDSNEYHSAISHTDKDYRVVINFNYII